MPRPPSSPQRPGPPPTVSARDTACRFLAAQAARFPDLGIEDPDTAGLDDRDAALAHAIADAAVRRWLTLSCLLDSVLVKPFASLEPALRAVLLCGSAQLLLLDRIPAHAAINESVEWAKRTIRPGAGSMTNAVLRRIATLAVERRARWDDAPDQVPLPDGRSLLLASPVLPNEPLARLAAATSTPAALLRRWRERFGPDEARRLALHGLVAAPTVLCTRHARAPLPMALAPHDSPDHRVFTGDRAALVALLAERDDIWVQDAASSRAVSLAQGLSPALIVDLCAGQGTKTRQLAALFPGTQVLACDADPARARTLAAAFRAHPSVRVTDADQLLRASAGAGGVPPPRADLVLLDVPCSNTGVLARRAEAKYRFTGGGTEQQARLVAIQRSIIEAGARLLAPGGHLIYSTCSLEAEENERQVEWACASQGLHPERSELTTPAAAPGEDAARYRDGAFGALLARPA